MIPLATLRLAFGQSLPAQVAPVPPGEADRGLRFEASAAQRGFQRKKRFSEATYKLESLALRAAAMCARAAKNYDDDSNARTSTKSSGVPSGGKPPRGLARGGVTQCWVGMTQQSDKYSSKLPVLSGPPWHGSCTAVCVCSRAR